MYGLPIFLKDVAHNETGALWMHRILNRCDLLFFVFALHLEEVKMDQDFVLHLIVGLQPGLRSFILRWRLFGYFRFFCLFVC